MSKRPLDVVCFFGRSAGLICFDELLTHPANYRIKALCTHRFLPKSESAEKTQRPEYPRFAMLCKAYKIPIYDVDSRDDVLALENTLSGLPEYDLVVSCSWRYKISQSVLGRAKFGGINLHRGKLPDYKGAEPVLRALKDGQKQVTITAHRMTDVIDEGEILGESHYNCELSSEETLAESAERIKKEILPLYPKLLLTTLEKIQHSVKGEIA